MEVARGWTRRGRVRAWFQEPKRLARLFWDCRNTHRRLLRPDGAAALSLTLGYGAILCLFALAYNAIPFFGQVLTGVPAAAVILVVAAILGLLAREVYRLRVSAWWGVLALGVLGALSNILTFRQVSMLDFYQKMGFSGPPLEMIKSMHILEHFSIPLWTMVWTVAGLGYLVYVRKYFTNP
jgi:hypothetical protein